MHEQVHNKTELIQYADDTVIFTSSDSIEKSKNQLSSCAMKLTNYFKEHQLSLNASKTEFIVFSKIARKNLEELLKIDEKIVEEKEEFKYVGVHRDNILTFQSEAKILIKNGPWNKNHIHNLQLFTKIIFKTNLERSCFESPSLLCCSHSIDWKKSFTVNRIINQLGLESFFLLIEI